MAVEGLQLGMKGRMRLIKQRIRREEGKLRLRMLRIVL